MKSANWESDYPDFMIDFASIFAPKRETPASMGWLSADDVDNVRKLLQRAKLPITPPAMTCEQFLLLMAVDKKVLDGRLRLVLLKAIGEAIITSDIDEQDVRATLLAAGVALE